MSGAPYSLGFTTLTQEVDLPELACDGRLPDWLRGSLLRTGPAAFEVGAQTYRHWFDGLAMLHRFRFADGRVAYANRYLRGQTYQAAMEHGSIQRGEFGTEPHRSLLQKALPLRRRKPTDNGNVNTGRVGDSMVALTETPIPVRFDPERLDTLGAYRFQDDIAGQITTAHPQFDGERRRLYNYLLEFGRSSKYHLYGIDADTAARRRIASIPVREPAYMHSFGMSGRYLILTEFPLVVNPLQLLLGGKPFIENYRWRPERGTVFHIVDKDSGEVVKSTRGEPFFAFHHVNAFERDGEVVVDLVAFPDATVIEQLYLDRLRSGQPVTATGRLQRIRIGLGRGDSVATELLAESPLEFPRFNDLGYAMRPYRYVYGASQSGRGFIDSLVKLDIETGAAGVWQARGCYPGEPVFVAAPQAETEDQGVILSVVLDTGAGASFLLVLDAQNFTELARAVLPHHIPFGFHGNFFPQPDV